MVLSQCYGAWGILQLFIIPHNFHVILLLINDSKGSLSFQIFGFDLPITSLQRKTIMLFCQASVLITLYAYLADYNNLSFCHISTIMGLVLV
jgi:hypothetical protein